MNFQEKIDLLTQQIANDPDNDQAYFQRGELYFRQKAYDQAQKDYEEALRINPEYSLALIAQGYILALKKDTSCLSVFEAVKDILSPESEEYGWLGRIAHESQYILEDATPSRYNERGIKLSDMGLIWQAVEDYSLAIQESNHYEYAYYNRGLAYNEVAQYQLAVEDFTIAIELNPDDSWSYNDRGNSYNYLKQYDLALADYKQGLEHDPENSALYNNIADLYFALGEFESAVYYFEEAIQRKPQEAAYTTNFAELYICMQQYSMALEVLNKYRVSINDSIYALVANILRLLIHTIQQQDTQALEQQLLLAQQKQQETHWNFDNLMRWWENNQALDQDVRAKIKRYLEIAIRLG
ncbi:MAG TPA: hypothetical protein DCS93_17530 [Microscillaceae bacterium]|nr:hypothetical protein [Microscillaceae bacterium]